MKYVLPTVAFFLLLSSLTAYGQCLKADFPFDGDANDVSGNGNHGTVFGATLTTDRFGIPNSAYLFDGVDDYIRINDTLGNFKKRDFSMSVWIETTAPSESKIFEKRDGCSPSDNHVSSQIAPNGSVTMGHNDGNGTFFGTNGNRVVNDGIWHHLVYIRTDSIISVYIDGLLDTVYVGPATVNIDNSVNLLLGNGACVGVTTHKFFAGKLDDFKVYYCALDEDDVTKLYSGILEAKAPSYRLSVYPNPANDLLTIKHVDGFADGTIHLMDLSGKVVYRSALGHTQKTTIQTTDIAPGLYIIEYVNEEGERGVGKVVIQ